MFDKVGMPHVMWGLQGEHGCRLEEDEGETMKVENKRLELVKPGSVTPGRVRRHGRRPGQLPGVDG